MAEIKQLKSEEFSEERKRVMEDIYGLDWKKEIEKVKEQTKKGEKTKNKMIIAQHILFILKKLENDKKLRSHVLNTAYRLNIKEE